MNSAQVRKRFLDFFESKGHPVLPSDSLVPANDPSVLFTGAGMNQFKDYFLGVRKDLKRAASCQKCFRTGDVEQRMHSRPVGRRMILAELRAKGVQPELAGRAVETGTEGQDELTLAQALAAKRAGQLKGLPREAASRRLFGYLSRRGFSSDIIYKVVMEIGGKTARSEFVEE